MTPEDQNDAGTPPGGNTEAITGEVVPAYPNLRPPWRRGQSGNRAGRPKTKPLTDSLKRQLGKKIPPEILTQLTKNSDAILKVIGKRPTYADLVAWSMIQQGVKGNIAAAARMFDRVEGRIPREALDTDEDRLDELMEVLSTMPAAPGEVNEGVDDDDPLPEGVTP